MCVCPFYRGPREHFHLHDSIPPGCINSEGKEETKAERNHKNYSLYRQDKRPGGEGKVYARTVYRNVIAKLESMHLNS